jgi:protein-tyrosine phosphatase
MMPEDLALDRVPPLERACNFRDFGGYGTRDGRRVRWGRLYRSGSLTQLTDPDRSAIGALGIRAICDLRRLDERARHPDPEFGPGVTHLVWDEPAEVSPLRGQSFAQSVGAAEARAAMIGMYAQMPVTLVRRLRGMFAGLLQGPGAPMILHCMAGKDRTGFAAALLLSALDVPHDVIVEDYVLTNRAVDLRAQLLSAEQAGLGIAVSAEPILALPREAQDAVLAADADYLGAGFAALEAGYGSVNAYLSAVIGVDDDARRQLARGLLQT